MGLGSVGIHFPAIFRMLIPCHTARCNKSLFKCLRYFVLFMVGRLGIMPWFFVVFVFSREPFLIEFAYIGFFYPVLPTEERFDNFME